MNNLHQTVLYYQDLNVHTKKPLMNVHTKKPLMRRGPVLQVEIY